VAIFSAAKIAADGDRLAAWVRQIPQLKRGPYVSAIQRFSDPPRIEDLEELTLDGAELNDLRRCRTGDCGLKLGDAEMTQLRQTIAAAGDDWKAAAQHGFRHALLARVQGYRSGGLPAVAPYHDRRRPTRLDAEFDALLDRTGFLARHAPELTSHLRLFPAAPPPALESFLYWSKEALGGKPIVAVTHVTILQSRNPELPETLVAAKQIYASHYMTGSLALTALTRPVGATRYLVYFNRSRVDVLGGMFGGLVRRVMESRLRGEAGEVVHALRRRLESGLPTEPKS
jgi:hypothetical protein